MAIGRRGFLGFLGGAVAAGPKLAQDLASATNQAGHGVPSASYGIASKSGIPDDWRISRISDLRSWIKGGRPEEQRERRIRRMYQMEAHARYRLDSMRSISAQHKYQMLLDGECARAEALRKMEWENELENLLRIG